MTLFIKIVQGVLVGLLLFPVFLTVVQATLAFVLWVFLPLLACALISLGAVLAWQRMSLPREEFARRWALLFTPAASP